MIKIDFTPGSDALYHDLYKEGIKAASNIKPGYMYHTSAGTWDFKVYAVNLLGETPGVPDSGTAKIIPTAPPSTIDDFSASDNLTFKIRMNWTDHGDAYKFDLYDGPVLVETNVSPGMELVTQEYSSSYSIRAINLLGSTPSNENIGTAHG